MIGTVRKTMRWKLEIGTQRTNEEPPQGAAQPLVDENAIPSDLVGEDCYMFTGKGTYFVLIWDCLGKCKLISPWKSTGTQLVIVMGVTLVAA